MDDKAKAGGATTPRDAKTDIREILHDVGAGHTKLDRGHASRLVAAIDAGKVSISGTY